MKTNLLIIGLLSGIAILCAGTAVYYKGQSAHYEACWADALDEIKNTLRPLPATKPEQRPSVRPKDSTPSDLPNTKLDELTMKLAEKDRQIAELKKSITQSGAPQRPPFESRQEQMEKLKTTAPEAYAAMEQRQKELRERIQTSFATKAATLLDRDTSNLNKEKLANYETMLNLLDETWKMTEKMTAPDTSQEERRDIRQKLAETTEELHPLLSEERNRRFVELGLASGFSDSEAEAFAKYIDKTIEATSLPGGKGGKRPNPPPAQ